MSASVAPHSQRSALRVAAAGAVGVVLISTAALALILLSITDASVSAAAGYSPLAWSAVAVLLSVLLVSLVVRRVQVGVWRGLPWVIGLLAFIVSFVPWLASTGVNPDLGTWIYRGLRVAPSIMEFWDLTLVMQSVDCARWGFDIYLDNNGCMQDASIYAPGMVWLQYIPFSVFSQSNVTVLGVAMMVISSLALVWLARQSAGIGQIALLVAAVGGPWLLLLERANIDAVVLWAAVVAVLVVRRWSGVDANSRLWPWIIAAALLWLMGTWKYYPFVMGAMLLPVLRLRHGWTVIAGFLVASIGFVLLTWQNFLFSSSSNEAMIDYGDFVVLGRVPLVARMLGTEVGAERIQGGDLLVVLLVLAAVAWGAGIALALRRLPTWNAMLALGGSSLYLASVLIAGFGWGYKAAFLLLAVPLVSHLTRNAHRFVTASALGALLLIAVQSVVVWNMVMVTTAGLIAAGFAAGLGVTVLLRGVLTRPQGELARR